MWVAIAITVLASSGNNIGKVLQKQATRTLPRLSLRQDIIVQYLRSTTWVTGMLADLAGALLMIAAFARAPVSVVQPVSAVGLVILLIFSHFYLKERLRAHEWSAAGVAFLGVVGLGVSAEPSHLEQPSISASRVLCAFCVMLSCLVLECWWRHIYCSSSSHSSSGRHADALNGSRHPDPHDAIFCGLEAGAYFGFSAAAMRTGFILSAKLSFIWVPLGLLTSVLLTSSGFILQTRGLKTGNTVIVCTMAAVASMISGVATGFIALDEKLPTQHSMKVIRFVSWAAILLGVTSLAGGAGGLLSVVRGVGACLPPPPTWAARYMPRSWSRSRAAKLRAFEAGGDTLPISQADELIHEEM